MSSTSADEARRAGSRRDAAAAVRACSDRLWERALATQPYQALRSGRPIEALRAESQADAESDATFGRDLSARLRSIELALLSDADRVTHEYLADAARRLERAADCWWTAFPYTPYNASIVPLLGRLIFGSMPLGSPDDVDRYLLLMQQFAAFVLAQNGRLCAQAGRGWRIPRPALTGARATISAITGEAPTWFEPAPERIAPLSLAARGRLAEGIATTLRQQVLPAFAAAIDLLDADYERRSTDEVGLAQFPGGSEAYALWTRMHLTLDEDAERLHALGHAEVSSITESMAQLRASVGFRGDEAAYAAHLSAQGLMHARTAADVEAKYERCIERARPLIRAYFHRTPRAAYGVKRLEAAAEPGMSYGYYEPPAAGEATGYYRYNGSGLDTRQQLNAAALIYHELVPGHHFHLARQAESEHLPEIRRQTLDLSVFNEGWAEYASALAGEMGLYDDPADAYGRLVHERFTAQRLVVDTGLNALGWSLERAREYMSRYTLESPAQVATETLRYSTDMPAQALAYRFGYLKFMELRAGMRATLGAAFDVRDYHEAVLAEGALPFGVLERHVARRTAALAERS